MLGLYGKIKSRKQALLGIVFVAAALFTLNALMAYFKVDMRFQSFFYDASKGWYLGEAPLFRALYLHGEKPAWILFFVSFILFGISFAKEFPGKNVTARRRVGSFIASMRKKRRGFLLIMLLMLLGPGLIVNTALKDHLGRPRPREVVEFGGEHEFVGPWVPGEAGRNSSFPSGHSSVAFYLFAPFFILEKDKKALRGVFLWSGVIFGFLVGLARIAQGGHFLSDVLWSGIIVFLTAYFLRYLLLPNLGD